MSLKELFYIRKSDRRVLVVLVVVIVAAIALMNVPLSSPQQPSAVMMKTPMDSTNSAAAADTTPRYYRQSERVVKRFPFDPNTADSTALLQLGLQPWQVRNIYKYRAAGGIYRKKEDFARLYGLTVKQYRELEPFIQISSDYLPASTIVEERSASSSSAATSSSGASPRDTLSPRYPVKIAEGEHIDLNAMDTALYRKVPGIGSYFARKISDYGRRLGGYVSVDQLDEIVDFPQSAKSYFEIPAASPCLLRINHLSLDELKRHPYINYYQAKAIVDYRRLHGPIHSLQQLHLLRDFPPEAIARLEPYMDYTE